MDFGVMFFSSVPQEAADGRYRMLLDVARRADAEGLTCLWLPERHFHPFGGLFPDPALLGAAVAMVTQRIQIRAGSLIAPLHDTLRIAESWSVVDNLSGGRVGISFGSGWYVDDFVFFPERYTERQEVMYRQIEEVRALWRGGSLRRRNSFGRELDVTVYPRPVQAELPVWVTSSGNLQTFRQAGRIGAHLLTHLLGQDVEQLGERIRDYRDARAESGLEPAEGKVAVMVHTFLGRDLDAVRARVERPMREYLRSAISLEQLASLGGGAVSCGHSVAPHEIPPETLEELLGLAFERYFRTASLLGTPESCSEILWRLDDAGVDEVACLVDFIDDVEAVLASLGLLAEFRDASRLAALVSAAGFLDDLEA